MASTRYPNGHLLTSGRRLSFIEMALALSVIVGLGFVTLRVTSLPPAAQTTEVKTVDAKTADAQTVEAKTEVPPVAADNATTRTP